MSIFSDILSAITTRGRRITIKMGLAKDFNDSKLKVGELGLVIDTDEVRIGLADGTTKSIGGVELSDIPVASATQDGLMAKAMVTKLSGIASGANFVQVVDDVTSTSAVQALSANQGKLINDKLGNLTSLQTTNKSNLVDAINEVKQIGNNVKQNTVDALLSVDDSLPITSDSAWDEIIEQIKGINTGKDSMQYVLATDDDFSGESNGNFKYIGSKEYVIIPNKIRGVDITSYEDMFRGDNVIKGVISFNNNIFSMKNMFRSNPSLTLLDLSNFNTRNVTDMNYMFCDCPLLTSLHLSSFDTSKVTNMHGMFNSNPSLISLDLSSFDTSNVTNMDGMFGGCPSLTSLDLSNFNTSNVTNMYALFRNCSSLTSLDLSSFNTSNATDMYGMFYGCSKVTTAYARTQPDADKFNTSTDKPATFTFVVK